MVSHKPASIKMHHDRNLRAAYLHVWSAAHPDPDDISGDGVVISLDVIADR